MLKFRSKCNYCFISRRTKSSFYCRTGATKQLQMGLHVSITIKQPMLYKSQEGLILGCRSSKL